MPEKKPPETKEEREKRNYKKYCDREKVLFMRNLPKGLRAHFKAQCALRGHTMVYVLTRLMYGYINREFMLAPPPPKRPGN